MRCVTIPGAVQGDWPSGRLVHSSLWLQPLSGTVQEVEQV